MDMFAELYFKLNTVTDQLRKQEIRKAKHSIAGVKRDRVPVSDSSFRPTRGFLSSLAGGWARACVCMCLYGERAVGLGGIYGLFLSTAAKLSGRRMLLMQQVCRSHLYPSDCLSIGLLGGHGLPTASSLLCCECGYSWHPQGFEPKGFRQAALSTTPFIFISLWEHPQASQTYTSIFLLLHLSTSQSLHAFWFWFQVFFTNFCECLGLILQCEANVFAFYFFLFI